VQEFYDILYYYEKEIEKDPNNVRLIQAVADVYYSLKQYNKAITFYKRALELDSKNNSIRTLLALSYLNNHDLKSSQTLLEEVLKEDPDNADAIGGLGRIKASERQYPEAEKLFERALKLEPDHFTTQFYLAELLIEQKKYAEAQAILEKLVKRDPKATWVALALQRASLGPFFDKVEDLVKKGDEKEALALLKDKLASDPKHLEIYLRLSQLYSQMQLYPEAADILNQGLKIFPKEQSLLIALGFVHLEKGDLNQAKNLFGEILKENENDPEALTGMGRYEELNHNAEAAITWYNKALKVDSNNLTALTRLAKLSSDAGNYKKALLLYKKVYKLQPKAPWINLAIEDAKNGRLLDEIKKSLNENDTKRAEFLWQHLLIEAPIAPYYLRLGLFYHSTKKYEKAIETYQKGLKIDPKSSELYAALGLAYLSKKEYKQANLAFKKSIKLDAKNPDALAGLGYVAMIDEKYDQAEKLMKQALALDPDRIAALSAIGELYMREKRYPEAQKAFEKLLMLRPKEKWIKLSLDDAKNGTTIDRIKELIKTESYAEAVQEYQNLLKTSPDNPRYYVGLGQMYMRLRDYEKSVEVNQEGLQKNPEENELRVALGYAYFFKKDLGNARSTLIKAIEIDPKDPEALAGLGHVYDLDGNYVDAETYFNKALAIDPKNGSALSFYSNLLMKQKRYAEAQEIYSRLFFIYPEALWVQRAWQDAVDGSVRDVANTLSDKEEFELALPLYQQLVCNAPEDASRYLALGQTYVNLERYSRGMEVFRQGLMEDPEAWYLWREIGFTYILLEDFDAAEMIFTCLLEMDPDDADAWTGLGRIQALNGSYCLAEEYYSTALQIDESRVLTLSFLAELRFDEQFNFSMLNLYDEIDTIVMKEKGQFCQPRPKWLRRNYNRAKNLTYVTLGLRGEYHEERQWDPTVHHWSALYQVYGGRALINYPINDQLTLWGSGGYQIYSLRDLLNRENFYSFDVMRFNVGTKWVFSPCWFLEARLGITSYSPYQYGTFKMYHGNVAEPTLLFTYHNPIEKLTFGFTSNSDLVARHFQNNRAKLVPYYYLTAVYERKVMKRGWVGVEGDVISYSDFESNNSQKVAGWFQWRPPFYFNHILFRYYVKCQTFAKNIPDYYTYKPQIINQLQMTLEKNWRVCWADTFYTSLSYSHGWQNTRTRFPQIIVVDPTVANPPYVWDNRQFDTVVGNIIYKYDQLQCTLSGDYYRDTEKYTMWTVTGELIWRF
jgi:tetratricopeptide (TPR) repeat protein